MRNAAGVLQAVPVRRQGPINGGGYFTGCTVGEDDRWGARLDTWNAIFRDLNDDEWTMFFRPGPVVGVDGCNILTSDMRGFGAGDQGNEQGNSRGSWDFSISRYDKNIMACHSMYDLYGTTDGANEVFKFTNFPTATGGTSSGMNPNGRGGPWEGSRTRGNSLWLDPINGDHAMCDHPNGVYRTTNFTAKASATWTLIPLATAVPKRGHYSQRQLIASDPTSSPVSGRTGTIYIFANSETYATGTVSGPALTIGNSFSINGTTVTMTGTTYLTCIADINAAAIANIRAFAFGTTVWIGNNAGGAITLANVSGTPLTTLGLASVSANAGSKAPGLYKSTDGGATWAYVTGSPSTCGNLKVDPTNGYLMLSGTANEQTAVFRKLVPSGPTWTAPSTPIAPKCGMISPHNAGHWYLFHNQGGCMFSSDYGAAWTYAPNSANAPALGLSGNGPLHRFATDSPWIETLEGSMSLGDVEFLTTINQFVMAEGFSCNRSTGLATSNATACTIDTKNRNIANLVAMAGRFTWFSDLMLSGQDKSGWVFTKEEIDARIDAYDFVPPWAQESGLHYSQNMSEATLDPTFMCLISNSKVWYSNDRGRTWALPANQPTMGYTGNIAAVTPLIWLILPGQNGGQAQITLDGGATPWTALTLGGEAWTRFSNAYTLNRQVLVPLYDGSGFVFYCHGWNLNSTLNTTTVGFWFVPAEAPNTPVRLTNQSVSDWPSWPTKDFWNAKFLQIPGTSDFLWTGGDDATGLFKSSTLLASGGTGAGGFAEIGTFLTEVYTVGVGAPEVPGDPAIIRCHGWGVDPADSTNKIGFWESVDGGTTFYFLSQFIGNIYDSPTDIAGDPNIYGRWAVCYGGKGVDIVDLELPGTPTPGLLFR